MEARHLLSFSEPRILIAAQYGVPMWPVPVKSLGAEPLLGILGTHITHVLLHFHCWEGHPPGRRGHQKPMHRFLHTFSLARATQGSAVYSDLKGQQNQLDPSCDPSLSVSTQKKLVKMNVGAVYPRRHKDGTPESLESCHVGLRQAPSLPGRRGGVRAVQEVGSYHFNTCFTGF